MSPDKIVCTTCIYQKVVLSDDADVQKFQYHHGDGRLGALRFSPISVTCRRIASEMKNVKLDGFIVQQEQSQITIREKFVWAKLALAAFMSFWLAGWTFGCVMLLQDLLKEFKWFTLLFSTPFFVGWFAGVFVLASTLFGRQQLNLAKDRLVLGRQLFVLFSKTEVLFKEIYGLRVDTTEDGLSQLTVLSSGEDLIIARNSKLEQVEALRDFLYEQIPSIESPGNFDKSETNLVARKRLASPANTSWQFEESFGNETVLGNQGSFEIGAFLVSLGGNLFWNGIVGVFVVKIVTDWMGPVGGNWWETLFIVPFVLIGLAAMFFLLAVVFDPFRKITYTFSSREIVWSWKYFGFIGRTKTWLLTEPVEIGVCHKEEELEVADGSEYDLSFSIKGSEEMAISRLNLAEAEWIATRLESDQSSYSFKRNITEV